MAITRALHMAPKNAGDEVFAMKLCLVGRFFHESEVISAKCRTRDLPATPPPHVESSRNYPFAGICQEMFNNGM